MFASHCQDRGNYESFCDNAVGINYNKKKDSILIIDDNEGMVSFIEDDMDFLNKTKVIKKDEINIISLSGNLAGFSFEIMQKKAKGLNIKWAIIDITLGGSVMTKEGNVKYTGVDVYEMLMEFNPEAKFVFYTGNNLNPYINANKKLIEQFKKVSGGKNIKEFVLFKTSMDMDTRRKYLTENLFNKEN